MYKYLLFHILFSIDFYSSVVQVMCIPINQGKYNLIQFFTLFNSLEKKLEREQI